MNTLTKIIGLLLLAFLGIPLVVAVIVATGVTKAVVSGEMTSKISENIVAQLPSTFDMFLQAARQPGAIQDDNTRAWIEAASKAKMSPSELLENTGISTWLEEEVRGTLLEMSHALQGEKPPSRVALDMKPLKKALTSQTMREYLGLVLAQLPECDARGIEEWNQRIESDQQDDPLLACNPGTDIFAKAIDVMVTKTQEIPDETPMFHEEIFVPTLDLTLAVNAVMWLMFLVAAVFIALGALLAGGGGRGFLQWSGGSVLVGGLSALCLGLTASGLTFSLMHTDPAHWNWGSDTTFWATDAGRLVTQQMLRMMGALVEGLFLPVTTIAVIACVVGIGLFGLSFLVGSRSDPSPRQPARW